MHELFLLIMVMIFTLLTMFGLVWIFHGWMADRDRMLDQGAAAPSKGPAE